MDDDKQQQILEEEDDINWDDYLDNDPEETRDDD